MQRVTSSEGFDVKEISGSFSSRLVLHEVELRDAAPLPEGYIVRIQKAGIALDSFSPDGLNVEVQNGRLLLPGGAVVVADGVLREGVLDAQVYFRNAEVQDLLGLFPENKKLASLRGTVTSLDAQVSGPSSALRVDGSAVAARLAPE